MNIFEAINACMADIGAIGKTSKNQQQGFMYRGIDAVMNAINPALIKNKVFVVPEVLEVQREERNTKNGGVLIYSIAKIKYTFYAEDGTHVDAIVVGEGMDSGDKSMNKAMSVGLKYALFEVFCIPTEEMKDPDEECHDVAPKNTKTKNTEAPQQEPQQVKGSEKVKDADVKAMVKILNDEGLSVEKVCELYKVASLKDFSQTQKGHLLANLAGVKERVNAN